jgi:hypothetical protein
MTIGPAPMIRIEEMSVRLGIQARRWQKWTQKKAALAARPCSGDRAKPRARALFRL